MTTLTNPICSTNRSVIKTEQFSTLPVIASVPRDTLIISPNSIWILKLARFPSIYEGVTVSYVGAGRGSFLKTLETVFALRRIIIAKVAILSDSFGTIANSAVAEAAEALVGEEAVCTRVEADPGALLILTPLRYLPIHFNACIDHWFILKSDVARIHIADLIFFRALSDVYQCVPGWTIWVPTITCKLLMVIIPIIRQLFFRLKAFNHRTVG